MQADASRALEEVSIILPVHNEATSIEGVVREIYDEINPRVSVRFIICEDGSNDGTKEVLHTLAAELPITLNMVDERRGYSKAVLDGLKSVQTPYALCLDSDGQCDPRDFWKLWEIRDEADIIAGWRVRRADVWQRRLQSNAFKLVFRALFRVPLHDPSCPFVLSRREDLDFLTIDRPVLDQGFWWEFTARASGAGKTFKEVPIQHRLRSAGETTIYTLKKTPGIAASHLAGLFKIRKEVKSSKKNRV